MIWCSHFVTVFCSSTFTFTFVIVHYSRWWWFNFVDYSFLIALRGAFVYIVDPGILRYIATWWYLTVGDIRWSIDIWCCCWYCSHAIPTLLLFHCLRLRYHVDVTIYPGDDPGDHLLPLIDPRWRFPRFTFVKFCCPHSFDTFPTWSYGDDLHGPDSTLLIVVPILICCSPTYDFTSIWSVTEWWFGNFCCYGVVVRCCFILMTYFVDLRCWCVDLLILRLIDLPYCWCDTPTILTFIWSHWFDFIYLMTPHVGTLVPLLFFDYDLHGILLLITVSVIYGDVDPYSTFVDSDCCPQLRLIPTLVLLLFGDVFCRFTVIFNLVPVQWITAYAMLITFPHYDVERFTLHDLLFTFWAFRVFTFPIVDCQFSTLHLHLFYICCW